MSEGMSGEAELDRIVTIRRATASGLVTGFFMFFLLGFLLGCGSGLGDCLLTAYRRGRIGVVDSLGQYCLSFVRLNLAELTKRLVRPRCGHGGDECLNAPHFIQLSATANSLRIESAFFSFSLQSYLLRATIHWN